MKRIACIMALLMLVLCVSACSSQNNESAGSSPIVNGYQINTSAPTDAGNTEGTIGTAIVLCEHEYGEGIVEQDPTCEEDGMRLLTCKKCGETVSQAIPAVGHRGTGASCEVPSFCYVCGELDEPAWGHEEEFGYCKHCGLEMGASQIPAETTQTTQPQE